MDNQTSPLLDGMSLLKDIGRLRAIAQVMIRYGFADLLQRAGVAGLLNKAGESLNWQESAADTRLSAPQRVRLAIQELGPTFIKLGQILATRVDLFDPEWISEFERLQDQVDPIDFARLRPQLEADLGASPESLFAWFDTTPLATASIGQVHRARLEDGHEVILKIRRPGIRPQIEADLRLLNRLAQLAESRIAWLARFRPGELVRQFATSLRQELDLAAECRSAQRIAENFRDDPYFRVPEVYWEWTCERLNVQEFVAGIPARNITAIRDGRPGRPADRQPRHPGHSENDSGRWLLPCRPACRQPVRDAGQQLRDDRLGHGRPAFRGPPAAGNQAVPRPGRT